MGMGGEHIPRLSRGQAEACLVAQAILTAGVQAVKGGLPPADCATFLLQSMAGMLPPRLRLCCHRHLRRLTPIGCK